MTNWKKAYTTYLFCAIGVVGAALTALQMLTGTGVDIPPWVLPGVAALGVFLRQLPQGPKPTPDDVWDQAMRAKDGERK